MQSLTIVPRRVPQATSLIEWLIRDEAVVCLQHHGMSVLVIRAAIVGLDNVAAIRCHHSAAHVEVYIAGRVESLCNTNEGFGDLEERAGCLK